MTAPLTPTSKSPSDTSSYLMCAFNDPDSREELYQFIAWPAGDQNTSAARKAAPPACTWFCFVHQRRSRRSSRSRTASWSG